MAFAPGDIVQLKSGSPALTVVAAGDDTKVIWYAEDTGAFHERSLPAVALEKLEMADFEEADDEDEEEDDED